LEEYCFKILSFEKNNTLKNFDSFKVDTFKESIVRDKKNSKTEIKLILPADEPMLKIASFPKSNENLDYLVKLVVNVLVDL